MNVSPERFPDPAVDVPASPDTAEHVAVLAGGCFWCVEAVYRQLDGVLSVTNGYAGGTGESADYESVSSGRTDHAEAVEVRFDPAKISYGQILKVFFSIAHDPTTRDRQGPDVGRQYRSAIFYVDEKQRRVADEYIKQLDAAQVFDRPIVTEVLSLDRFYQAEAYHQDYAERNPLSPYILFNARPKVQKVRTLLQGAPQAGLKRISRRGAGEREHVTDDSGREPPVGPWPQHAQRGTLLVMTPSAATTRDLRARSEDVRKGWACLVACAAVVVALASLACGYPASAPSRTSEASIDLLPDDRAWSSQLSADSLDCTDRVAIPSLEQIIASKWSPDSSAIAVARVITIPSRLTITGYEEDPVLSVLDIRTGEVRELGQGNKPQWSGSGAYLSFWKDDGYLHVLQGDATVAKLEVSHPDVRWVSDVLYYWYAEEIRVWNAGVTEPVARVASDLVPRYPRDDAYFSSDGERFTITRYAMDGSTERYIGVTATGEMTALEDPDITYTEWSPRGQTLLMRSQDRVALRERDGTLKSALLASLPGPVHGWSSDGRLLLGVLSPTAPASNSFDRFAVWDGAEVGSFATLPNVLGARTFSPDGRYFTGVSRAGASGTQLELYRCGVTYRAAATPRADTTARSRAQFIETDGPRFVRPVAGMVVQFVQGRHTGVDLSAPFGSLLFADDDGVVNAVGWVPVGGRRVCVMHSDGLESCGYHTSLSLVAVGDAVVRGQPIALVGMTGLTGGPHVHWEVRHNGRIVDPLAQ